MKTRDILYKKAFWLLAKSNITLIIFGILSVTVYGQVLKSENFNSLNDGNIGTSFDGSSLGQAGFRTQSSNGAATSTSTNAANSNFQILTLPRSTFKAFKYTGPNGDGGIRYMWQDGLSNQWANRAFGNDIFQLEYTFNTGSVTTSKSYFGMQLFNQTFNFTIGYAYNTDTRELTGVAYLLDDQGRPENVSLRLSPGGLFLNSNNSYTIACSYNSATGEVLWKTDPTGNTITVNPSLWIPGQTPNRLDFIASSEPGGSSDPGNASEASLLFYDFEAAAVATSNLLSNEDEILNEVNVKVYPNPANNILTVSSPSQQLSSIEVVDLNGRLIKSVVVNNTEINTNIEDLKPGLYILNILSNDATITRKFIKE